MTDHDGETYSRSMDGERLGSQLQATLDVLTGGDWWTLSALAGAVSERTGKRATEASISARLRDLRKDKFGGHNIESQRDPDADGLWKYRLAAPSDEPVEVTPTLVVRSDGANKMRRRRREATCVGDGHRICPRCGWRCKHLVIPHYASPWREHGGLCGECCIEAAKHFDANGWPDPLPEDVIYRVGDMAADPVQQTFGDGVVAE